MNKVTCVKNRNYTTISNFFLQDINLSLKAKGLLALVMTLPADWDFSIGGIEQIIKEGRTSIYNAIDELKQYGYCTVVVIRENGIIKGNDYTFYEQPYSEKPHTENLNTENLNTENLNTENLNMENLNMENPHAENKTQINTNIQNTKSTKEEENKNNIINISSVEIEKTSENDDAFIERMYKLYPTKCPCRGVSLGKCRKDKQRIKSLLKVYSKEEIERVINLEIKNKFGKTYMLNFSTFLNNFPDPNEICESTSRKQPSLFDNLPVGMVINEDYNERDKKYEQSQGW